jgi:hypothetical protein
MLERLIQEASDPETDPERLRKLAQHSHSSVFQSAWRNPSLPEDAWYKALLRGQPEPWDNPMAPFYLIALATPSYDVFYMEEGARWATYRLWKNPERCSAEGKELLAAKIIEWWSTSESASMMMEFLGFWAHTHGPGSQAHRDTVRIIVQCVRTIPNLTPSDLNALKYLEEWSKEALGQDGLAKAAKLAFSKPVKALAEFANYSLNEENQPLPKFGIDQVILEVIECFVSETSNNFYGKDFHEDEENHSRFLADLIRREMPVPPTAE